MSADGDATILLIGDDDLLGRALDRALSAEGLQVRRGAAAAGAERPALVVFGPCAGGDCAAALELERLRASGTVPLLVIRSGSAVEERLASWSGPLAYIAQPFGGRQFVEAVKAQLAGVAARV